MVGRSEWLWEEIRIQKPVSVDVALHVRNHSDAEGTDTLPLIPCIQTHVSFQENVRPGSDDYIFVRFENTSASTGSPWRENGLIRREGEIGRKAEFAREQQRMIQRREEPQSIGSEIETRRNFRVVVEMGVKDRRLCRPCPRGGGAR